MWGQVLQVSPLKDFPIQNSASENDAACTSTTGTYLVYSVINKRLYICFVIDPVMSARHRWELYHQLTIAFFEALC